LSPGFSRRFRLVIINEGGSDLEADAIEIRMRATRRLDQLRQAQKDSIGLNRGAAVPTRVDEKTTLASQGIDKNLADRAWISLRVRPMSATVGLEKLF
jgi:hypothetical protein